MINAQKEETWFSVEHTPKRAGQWLPFVFNTFSEFELNKAIKVKVLSLKMVTEGEPIPEDMENPKAYCIENARRKREHDKLVKEVEE